MCVIRSCWHYNLPMFYPLISIYEPLPISASTPQIFMTAMVIIFLVTFLVFDASELDLSLSNAFDTVPEERRVFFGALCGLLALTQQVLWVRSLIMLPGMTVTSPYGRNRPVSPLLGSR